MLCGVSLTVTAWSFGIECLKVKVTCDSRKPFLKEALLQKSFATPTWKHSKCHIMLKFPWVWLGIASICQYPIFFCFFMCRIVRSTDLQGFEDIQGLSQALLDKVALKRQNAFSVLKETEELLHVALKQLRWGYSDFAANTKYVGKVFRVHGWFHHRRSYSRL